MAIFKSTKREHRGTDIESPRMLVNSGAEYPDKPMAGDIFYRTDLSTTAIYTGKDWSALPGSGGLSSDPDPAVESIAGWAARKLPNDNDVIYIRRKDDRLFWCEGNKMGGVTWQEINGTGVLPTGLKQSIVEGDSSVSPAIEEATPTYIPAGWYQDSSANLFKHEGAGVWTDTSNTQAKKLTKSAEAGEMEYLGQ